MGNFRSNARGGGGGGFRGRDSGSRGRDFGGRGGDSGRFNRRSSEMHDATCSKCGKPCQVPFRPTGDKPVFCNDCFKKNEGSGSFNSRSNDRASLLGSGAPSAELNQINAKLDKILQILENLEIEVEEEDGDEDLDEEDEDLDDDEEDSDDGDDDEDDEEDEEEDYSKISLVKDA